MSDVKLTPEQQSAVDSTGGALLVSAAAGSGKTKVLVERLMKRVCDSDEGVDVDDFLIITYTNAAAAELRGKILDAIYDRIAADPENKRLRYEADVCGRAQISTIHSFCSAVIRENSHVLDLDPGFRIADDTEAASIREDVINDLIEERYSSGDSEFYALADTLGAGRDDSGLVKIVMDTYDSIMSHPYPEKWVEEEIREYFSEEKDLISTKWGEYLLKRVSRWAAYRLESLEKDLKNAEDYPDFCKKYGPCIAGAAEWVRAVYEASSKSWDDTYTALRVPFPKAPNVRGFEEQKKVRNAVKDEYVKYVKLISETSAEAFEDIRAVAPIVEGLLRLVISFKERYEAEKRKRGVLDFGDQEHLALKLLVDERTGEPTEVAKRLRDSFYEIMVDEYQDVNAIQEMIFSAVSRGDNIFMVGDVKQSIYRFRLADPLIFLSKYRDFKRESEAAPGEERKILLQKNFRSREGVLDAVNFLFRNLMSVELGEMDYTDEEALYAGNTSYADNGEKCVELCAIDDPDEEDGEDEDTSDRARTEAAYAAGRILELMSNMRVSDGNGGLRELQFRDIAVLMRSRTGFAAWTDELSAAGIPVSTEAESDFFNTPEISIAMSFLAVIDNPRQDIPLLNVLRSPVYALSTDELGIIRSRSGKSDLYASVLEAVEINDKCARFVDDLDYFRYVAPDLSSDELIWKFFNRTGFMACVSAMPGGGRRRENLMTLIECARRFESQGYRGLFSFVSFMEKLAEKGVPPISREGKSAENAVTLMTIHKSKGLEFPVVIVADLAHKFNLKDLQKPILIHKTLGIGTKRTDAERRIEYPTVARKAIAELTKQESLSEELRVLYVALTRAREKLIILTSVKDAEKTLPKLAEKPLPAPPINLEGCESFAYWILIAALHRPETSRLRFGASCENVMDKGEWDIRYIKYYDIERPEPEEKYAAAEDVSEEKLEKLRKNLDWEYPYKAAETMPSKLTATELKGAALIDETHEDADELMKHHRSLRPPTIPAFTGVRGLTAAQKGTATHMFMQYCDYETCTTREGVERELSRLLDMRFLSTEQADAVDPDKITRFFSSDVGRELLSADKVWRELKFSTLIPSDKLWGKGGDEVLLQGVVDCLFISGGKLTVLDFKTDYVTDDTVDERAKEYRGQLYAYSYAVEKIMGRAVDRRILFFLSRGISAEV